MCIILANGPGDIRNVCVSHSCKMTDTCPEYIDNKREPDEVVRCLELLSKENKCLLFGALGYHEN